MRGRPQLVSLMNRLVNPGKRLPDKDGEPDFYKISREHPLPEGAAPPSTPGPMAGHASMHQPQPQLGYPPQASPHAYGHSPYGHSPYYPYPAPYGQPVPQQMYWPGQVASPSYQGNPYGYYPPSYPPMMMVPQQPQSGAAQQAMYYMAQGPYHQQQHPQFMPQRMPQLPGTAVAMPEGAKPGDDVPMAVVNTTTETKEDVKPDANGEGVASGKKAGDSVESVKEVKDEEAVPPSTKDLKPVTPSTKEEGEEKKERSEDEEDKTSKI